MNFILLPAGSGGFCLEWTLSRWFPPRLVSFTNEDRKQVLEYHSRIGRKGVERHPTQIAGARIIRVFESKPSRSRSRSIPCASSW